MAENNLGLSVGATFSFTKTVSEQDVADFARVSGDYNPLHLDAGYAGKTRFKQRIAHGALTLAFVSAVLGTKLVGREGTVVFLGQSVRFLRPVLLGDTVTATCQVTKVDTEKRIVTLACTCANQKGAELLSGEATVLIDPMPFGS